MLFRIFWRALNLPGSSATLSLSRDLGQELCAPPFQVVCPFQAFVLLTLTSMFDLWQICWTDLYDFVARQFCRLISQQRLRPVTLRATLSDGLPFSSSIKLTQWLCQKLIIYLFHNINNLRRLVFLYC